MRVYISGKITGLKPGEARKNFALARIDIRRMGHKPVNPLDNGLEESAPWIRHLTKDLEMLHDCDAIYMLDGWTESKGASIEYAFALQTGKKVLFQSTVRRDRLALFRITAAIHEVTGLRLEDYKQKRRNRDGFYARMLFVHHCRQEKMRLSDIAALIQRDRSSMFHFLNKYRDEVRFNVFFRDLAERVSNLLNEKDK